MTKRTQPELPLAPANFEAAIAELESLVAQMESNQLPLEEALSAFERGNVLLQFCGQALANATQKVQILSEGNQLVSAAPKL